MNNKALTLSLVMAVLAVFFVQSYVASIEEEAQKKFGTEVLVIAAKQDIAEMETIDETMIELKPIPKRFLEPGAVAYSPRQNQEAVLKEVKELAGSVAMVPIQKGEQITLNKITEAGMRTGLAPQITPGRRAIALPVDDVSGVSKLIKPGDRVDVVALIESQGKSRTDPLGAVLAKTILQDVGVLSVGKNVTNNIPRIMEREGKKMKERSLTQYDGFSTVTIEVEPAQAQAVSLLLAGSAKMMILLRNNDDNDRVNLSGMTLHEVLGPGDAARLTPTPPQARQPAGNQQGGGR